MMYRKILAIYALSVLMGLSLGGCGKLSLEKVEEKALEITVKVDGCGAGSGVIYQREGNTYFVLTAHHVVEDAEGICLIVTPYKIEEREAKAREVRVPVVGADLAILTFESDRDYKLAKWGNSERVAKEQTVYVAGFPSLDDAKPRPWKFKSGKIVSLDVQDRGYSLTYNNPTQPGMSGGPLLNNKGQVIGIHGRGDRKNGVKTGENSAIPISIFLNSETYVAGKPLDTPQSPLKGEDADLASPQPALADLRGYFVLPELRATEFQPD